MEWPTASRTTKTPCLNKCLKLYRSLYVINTIANQVYGKVAIPSYKIIFLIGTTFLTFGLIRLRHILDGFSTAFSLTTVLTWPVEMTMTLNVLSSLSKCSNKLKPTLQLNLVGRSRIVRKYFNQQLRSIRPIQCQVGDFYGMKRNASIIMVDSVIHSASTLLVTLRK